MGEGTSEIRHLRDRVLALDDAMRGMGERIRLLDEKVAALEKAAVAGSPPVGGCSIPGGPPAKAVKRGK